MSAWPAAESSVAHRGGDLGHIAAWLLDRLDRRPPPPGGTLTLYLCHHPHDDSYFGSAKRDAELSRELLAAYRRELAWDARGFGDLRFDLAAASPPAQVAVTRRETAPPRPTVVEFVWHATRFQSAPGTISLVRRWMEPLDWSTRLRAALRIVSGARISRHIDRWQAGVRWLEPAVYLPDGRTELTAGPYAGCDLYAPLLPEPLVVAFDGATGEWSWSELDAVGCGSAGGQDEAECKCCGPDGSTLLALRGIRLGPRTLAEQERENRLPSFNLELVGFLLPLPQGWGGYGVVPDGLPHALAARVRTALRLPGEWGWLHFDEEMHSPYFLTRGGGPPGEPLREQGPPVRLAPARGREGTTGRWRQPEGILASAFHGELALTPPLVARLACGGIAENVPDDLFVGYADSALGRPPVRLVSDDGRRYRLKFNPAAKHPVFLLAGAGRDLVYKADPATSVELDVGSEFVVGSARYRLCEAGAGSAEDSPFVISTASVGGTS